MENQATQTVQSVVDSVIKTVAIIAPLASLGTFGITEFAKKVGLPGRLAGVFSYVIGFLIAILVMKLTTGILFSALSVLIGVIVAVGTPGAYSGIKALLTPAKEIAPAIE